MSEYVMKRRENYFWEKALAYMAKPLVLLLIHTPITPNMVTIFNFLVNIPIICVLCWLKRPIWVAVFIQIYAYLDIVDGNLARNKNMKSELGRKLDIITDTIFYTVGVFFIGYFCCGELIWKVMLLIVIQQIYGLIATFYIVPNMKKNESFLHTKLKAFFMKQGFIFGMDAIFQCLIMSLMLPFTFRRAIFIVCPILWIMDLVYRLYELKWVNRKRNK